MCLHKSVWFLYLIPNCAKRLITKDECIRQYCIHLSHLSSQSTDSCVQWVAWNIRNNHPGDGSTIFITMVECFICVQS